MKRPEISVIIITYNEEEHIEKLLTNLKNQTYKNFEIIVIDGKSQDRTLEILKKFGVKIIVDTTRNLSYCRNLGIKNSKGKIIVSLDADMEINDKFLESILKCFEDPDVEGIKLREYIIQDTLLERLDFLRSFYKHKNITLAVQVFRRGIYYDESLSCFGEDICINKKIKGKVVVCHKAIARYHRFHTLKELYDSWKKYPTGFYYYRKYENYPLIRTLAPLFLAFTSPIYVIDGLIKFKDIRALLIPMYDFVRSLSYLIGIFKYVNFMKR